MVEKKHSRVDDLLNFKLPNGKRLGDATKADLAEASAYYRAKEAEAEAKLKMIKQYLDSILVKP
jgi:hypothetical protein